MDDDESIVDPDANVDDAEGEGDGEVLPTKLEVEKLRRESGEEREEQQEV